MVSWSTGPKTFPYQLNYFWLENKGESFETDHLKLKKVYFCLINGKGIILNKALYAETTYNKRSSKAEFLKMLRNVSKTKFIIRGQVYFVLDMWSTGPYHFYVDILSKLVELKGFLGDSFQHATIVLFKNKFTEKVVIPLLELVGFGNLKWILIEENKQYCIIGSNAFVTKPHKIGTNNPKVIRKVYDLLHLSLGPIVRRNFGSPKMVYYHRVNRNRVVENDTEIIRELKKLGVYCTTFDDLSFLEAFALMSTTKLFIGIHGGGLTNMLFLKPGSRIIEIKNDNLNPKSHCYWHLARSLNFDYTLFVAETVGNSNVMEGKGCNVIVEVDQLINLINQMIQD
jgi:hypothetical protein